MLCAKVHGAGAEADFAALERVQDVYKRQGYETCHEMVFKGLVLRCETQTPAPSPVLVNARTEDSPRGAATVSYTHLDVYKRQGLLSWEKNGRSCLHKRRRRKRHFFPIC